MKINKETAKALGIKDFIIYVIFIVIESVINLPYFILKTIIFPFYYIYIRFLDKKAIFYLTKIKNINIYARKLSEKYKQYYKNNQLIVEIPKENINIGKKVKDETEI